MLITISFVSTLIPKTYLAWVYKELCDNDLLAANSQEIAEINKNYELLAKTAKNQLLRKDQLLQQLEINNKANLNRLIIIVMAVVAVLFIAGLMYSKIQSKTRSNVETEHRM